MPDKYCGSGFLVLLQDLITPANYNIVGSMKDTSLSISNEMVDVTSKSSAVTRQLLDQCGISSLSISGSGVFTDDLTVQELQVASQTGAVIVARLVSDYGDKYEGPWQITSFDRNGGYNGAEEYSVSFESASDITYTPAP